MSLYIVYKSESAQKINAINSQVLVKLVKLNLGSERADISEVVCCLIPFANCFIV